MNEELARSLIKKSTINTSEDFTGKLLDKLETELSKPEVSLNRIRNLFMPVMALIIGALVIFVIVLLDLSPRFILFDFQIQIMQIPFLVILLIPLLWGANQVIKMNYFLSNLLGRH